jgi:hypothetical protein
MLKSITAVMTAAAIAGVLTLLSATNARLDAGPLAKPTEAALKACTQQPWPYFNCVGTPARKSAHPVGDHRPPDAIAPACCAGLCPVSALGRASMA